MDPDLFDSRPLRFQVRKPSAWRFLPPAWSPTALIKRRGDFEETLLRHAQLPFCCAMGHHESRAHAYPTMQVVARKALPNTYGMAAMVLELLTASIKNVHPTFKVVDATARNTLAGFKSVRLRGTFSLILTVDGNDTEISVLSRSNVIFAPQATFHVALSGSDDPEYFDESEFDAILESIRIDS